MPLFTSGGLGLVSSGLGLKNLVLFTSLPPAHFTMPSLVVLRYQKMECCNRAPWDKGMADPLKTRLSPRVTTPNVDTVGQILQALVGSVEKFRVHWGPALLDVGVVDPKMPLTICVMPHSVVQGMMCA